MINFVHEFVMRRFEKMLRAALTLNLVNKCWLLVNKMLKNKIFTKNWSKRKLHLISIKIEVFSQNKTFVNPWKIWPFSKNHFPKIFQKYFPNSFSKFIFLENHLFIFQKSKRCWLMQSAFHVFHQYSSNFISASFWANFTFESAKHIYFSRTFHFLAFHSHHIHLPVYGVPSFRCTRYLCVIL